MRVVFDAANEVVVHSEAARGQAAKLRDVAFDLGSEDAGRRAGGAARDAPGINELNARTARRELVSDGTAHDASPDDGDVHKEILSGSGQKPLRA
jgi:hypothetical protein